MDADNQVSPAAVEDAGVDEGASTNDVDVKKTSGERLSWGGQLEFIFTCLGYAVGLGNVWRFPYLCYQNGGGAFLVPYFIMLATVGLPLFFLELAFGQFASLGPISVWKINPLFKGLGMAMVSVSWIISIYYNIIIAYAMIFIVASFASVTSELPWVSCDNWWNTESCLDPDLDSSEGTSSPLDMTSTAATDQDSNATSSSLSTPSEEYFYNYVLEISASIDEPGGLNWKVSLALLLCWIIVLGMLIRGIKSLGKVVYFTSTFPYIMLTILLIRGLTLPGAADGLVFYLKPDFSRLNDPLVWSDAATQIFYSLSACLGGLIAMSSFSKFNNNCYRDSVIVALLNCGTSFYAGFVIFSVLGFMAREKGVDVADVAASGPGLAFVVYPEALSRMAAPQLWAILFFIMMAMLGVSSQCVLVETVLSAITDEFYSVLKDRTVLKNRWKSITFRALTVLFCFLVGLPMASRGGLYLLDVVDHSVSGFPLLVVGMVEALALAWIYGYDRLASDITMMLGHPPNIYWKACWMGVTPGVIFVTIVVNVIFYEPQSYPEWARALGWLIVCFPISLFFGVFGYRFCRRGGYSLMRELMKPTPDWGPLLSSNRTGVYEIDMTQPTYELIDWSGRPYLPQTIMLARQPDGSAVNVTTVSNYSGRVPVVLNVKNKHFLSPQSLPQSTDDASNGAVTSAYMPGDAARTQNDAASTHDSANLENPDTSLTVI